MNSKKNTLDLSAFGHSQAQSENGETLFDGVLALYTGATPAKHFPLKHGADGKKIEVESKSRYQQYAREDKSDGYSVKFVAENGKDFYCLFSDAPSLELGMYSLTGTGSAQRYDQALPLWVTSVSSLVEVAKLVKTDPVQVYSTQQGQGGEDL